MIRLAIRRQVSVIVRKTIISLLDAAIVYPVSAMQPVALGQDATISRASVAVGQELSEDSVRPVLIRTQRLP